MLKKHELHDRTGQPVVNRDKSHDRTGPVVNRDTRHESNHGPVGCRSSSTRQLGCVFQDVEPPKSVIDFTEELRHAETDPTCKIHESYCTSRIEFETKILRSDRFAQVNLISVAPMLQNLRIGLRKRQNGKSDVPVKQRGSWPKIC